MAFKMEESTSIISWNDTKFKRIGDGNTKKGDIPEGAQNWNQNNEPFYFVRTEQLDADAS